MIMRRQSYRIQQILILIVVSVCAYGGIGAFAQEDSGYVIGVEDVLEIKVWGHEDLSRSVTVASDGYFSFPLIGNVKAGGLTAKQVEGDVARRLDKDYIVNPQVTVTVTGFKSKKVYVFGEIAQPGIYYLSKSDTLLEVISQVGGVTSNVGREIIIVRPSAGSDQPASLDSKNSELIHIDLQALLSGDIDKNVTVQNNDTIYVPKASMFSVFGEVGRPGSYSLENELSVLEALSLAGGPTTNADTQKLELLRKEDGVQKKIILNVRDLLNAQGETEDIFLRDGDVLYQPRAQFFFIMGEVGSPGSYKLEDGMTVTKAISVAGGFTERASKNRVQIIRDEEGKQVKHKAEPNELIQPQDIIEVPQSFF